MEALLADKNPLDIATAAAKLSVVKAELTGPNAAASLLRFRPRKPPKKAPVRISESRLGSLTAPVRRYKRR